MSPADFQQQYAHLGGFDWARQEHVVVIVDRGGAIVYDRALPETAEGWAAFRDAIAPLRPLAIAVETSNGVAVERLLELGVAVYPMNPKAAKSYRNRKAPSGVKDDHLDGWSFADALRTDGHGWRKLSPESEPTKLLRLLCRDQVALIEQRTAVVNGLQQCLVEYYPAALEAFEDWTMPSSWAFIEQFPTPEVLEKRGKRKWQNFLHAQKLYSPATAQKRLEIFARAKAFASPSAAVTAAKSLLAVTLAKQLRLLEGQIQEYQEQIEQAFQAHPDHEIFDSLPGAGIKTKARLLGEIGTDPQRFADGDALRAYAGSAPVTKQSGKSRRVYLRQACNKPLRNAMHWLAELSRPACDWAQAYYQMHREQGDSHQGALRRLAGRWQKILWRMLQTRQKYDPGRRLADMVRHGSPVLPRLREGQTATA
jgi:transposase